MLEYFISEMTVEDIGVRTLISGSKLVAVPPIKFNSDLIEYVVSVASIDQEWQEASNAASDSNLSSNIEYLYGALSYKGSQQTTMYAK
jgi:hypothetical protein